MDPVATILIGALLLAVAHAVGVYRGYRAAKADCQDALAREQRKRLLVLGDLDACENELYRDRED